MTTEKIAEENISGKENSDILADAVRLVNAEIERQRQKLKELIKDNESPSISLDGETSTGYPVTMQVSPSDVAVIMSRHDYPIWNVLGLDAPDEMWSVLAEMTGLRNVHYVDINL